MIQETVKRLLHHVKNEADSHRRPFPPFICMVPDILRNVNPDCFNPKIVSIGPLHRKDKNVQAFEGRKVSYLINLMERIDSQDEEILESCTEKAYALMSKIKASYIWTAETSFMTDAEIAEMMVMDACFILEFMIQLFISLGENSFRPLQFATIRKDLLLLENQIPLFFLDAVFQCTILKFWSEISLIEVLSPILYSGKLFKRSLKMDNIVSMSTDTDHILSLLHQCYKPPDNIKKGFQRTIINSAVDLDLAGVNFKPSEADQTWDMGMEVKQYNNNNKFPAAASFLGCFWSKPTLTMPELKVHDSTEFVLRNLIAYEQSFPTQGSYVTSYASTMDKLVNTQDDVAKLVESGVIYNIMGSNQEAANMINSIGKHVICRDFFYDEELRKLKEYCNGYWPKHLAWMRRTYFNNPWNIIALVAGIILFVLQVVQTIYTIRSDK